MPFLSNASFYRGRHRLQKFGCGLLIFYLITGCLCCLTAIIYTWWFVQAKYTYDIIQHNVIAYQYSTTNFTVVLPPNIVLEPQPGPTITYFFLFTNTPSNDPILVDWNPCNSATAFTWNGNIKYCSNVQTTGSSGKTTMNYATPYPAYYDAYDEYYKPYMIAMIVLWVYGGPCLPLIVWAVAQSKSD